MSELKARESFWSAVPMNKIRGSIPGSALTQNKPGGNRAPLEEIVLVFNVIIRAFPGLELQMRRASFGVILTPNVNGRKAADRHARKQYSVHTVRDEPVRLRDQLDHIAADGGRVVSIIWQPARQVALERGLPPYEVASGYVVVSEHELPEEAGPRPLEGPK